jgi:3-oxoacyl-[acyl-carrier protein] reductase
MDLGIKGRRAIVPASSGGLGLAVATALAAAGARVAMCSHDRDRIERAAEGVGDAAVPLVVDVTSPEGAEELIDGAEQALGGPADILILNGPGPQTGTFATTATEQYGEALDRIVLPAVAACRRAVPGMRARGWGRVVAITSIGVRQPIPTLILSNTARTGLTAFLKTLALEVAADGVTVNSVQPGLHGTARLQAVFGEHLEAQIERIPARRLGGVAEFGAFVAFLCSEHASYITGVAIPVDGGAHVGLQ